MVITMAKLRMVPASRLGQKRKLLITMASYALQRHLGWRTQSRLGQQWPASLCPPPRVAHASLDQNSVFYWKQLGPCSDERRCPCESTKCAGQAFHTFLLPAPIQPPPKSIFGPGGLRAPPVVADESEAGHCVHLFFYIFFYFIFLRLPFFIHFYELWAKLNYCNQC